MEASPQVLELTRRLDRVEYPDPIQLYEPKKESPQAEASERQQAIASDRWSTKFRTVKREDPMEYNRARAHAWKREGEEKKAFKAARALRKAARALRKAARASGKYPPPYGAPVPGKAGHSSLDPWDKRKGPDYRPKLGTTIPGPTGVTATPFDVTITASRTSGEIPFGVNFHVVNTNAPDGNLVHTCYTTWASATTVAPNAATGITYGAVIDTEGSHTVSVTITTPAGRVGLASVVIIATAFSGTTYYVDGAAANDADTGLVGHPWKTIGKAITTLFGTDNFQLLFESASKYNPTVTMDLEGQTHIRIGSYGAGKAIISRDTADGGDDGALGFAIGGTSDLTIYNLELRGRWYTNWAATGGTEDTNRLACYVASGLITTHLTLWKFDITGWGHGISRTGTGDTAHWTMHTVTVDKMYGYNVFLANGQTTASAAMINCTFNGLSTVTGSHNVRFPQLQFAFIYGTICRHNRNTGTTEMAIRGAGSTEGETTKYFTVSECTFGGTSTLALIALQCAPVNNTAGSDHHVRDGVVNRNLFDLDSAATLIATCLILTARNLTVRNNVVLGGRTFAGISHWQVTPGFDGGYHIYGNSMHELYTASSIRFISFLEDTIGSGDIGNQIFNNIYEANNAASSVRFIQVNSQTWYDTYLTATGHGYNCILYGSGVAAPSRQWIGLASGVALLLVGDASFAAGHNIYLDPVFVSGTDLHLQVTSPCIGAGVAHLNDTLYDRDGVARGAAVDIGAYEYVA